jgi:hypothetical protein
MLVELIENGVEAEKRKQQEFLDLAERLRRATDPKDVSRLGDQMGRMVFGGRCYKDFGSFTACGRGPIPASRSSRQG